MVCTTCYNLSNISTNASNMLFLTQNVNAQLMFGYFGTLVVAVIGVVAFMSFMKNTNDFNGSILGTMYIVGVLSLMFYIAGLVPSWFFVLTTLVLGFTIAALWNRGN